MTRLLTHTLAAIFGIGIGVLVVGSSPDVARQMAALINATLGGV